MTLPSQPEIGVAQVKFPGGKKNGEPFVAKGFQNTVTNDLFLFRSPLSKMKERVSSRLESFGLRQGSSSSSGNLNLSAKNEASKTALQNVHDMPSTSKASPPPAEPETTSSPPAPSIGSRKRAQSGNINSTSGVSTTPDSFRKRKLAFSRDSPSKLPDAKKPLLEQATTLSDEQEQTKSHIPRLKL